MKPTPGRMVRYVLRGGEPRPAVVTRVRRDGSLNLTVFLDQMDDLVPMVPEEGQRPGETPGYCCTALMPAGAYAAVPGFLAAESAEWGEDGEEGCWHWPERE